MKRPWRERWIARSLRDDLLGDLALIVGIPMMWIDPNTDAWAVAIDAIESDEEAHGWSER